MSNFSPNFKFKIGQPKVIYCHLIGDFCLTNFKFKIRWEIGYWPSKNKLEKTKIGKNHFLDFRLPNFPLCVPGSQKNEPRRGKLFWNDKKLTNRCCKFPRFFSQNFFRRLFLEFKIRFCGKVKKNPSSLYPNFRLSHWEFCDKTFWQKILNFDPTLNLIFWCNNKSEVIIKWWKDAGEAEEWSAAVGRDRN